MTEVPVRAVLAELTRNCRNCEVIQYRSSIHQVYNLFLTEST